MWSSSQIFFYWRGIVHDDFVARGDRVNKEFYLKVKKCLRETVRRKTPEAWTNKTMTMHLLTRRSLFTNFWGSMRRVSTLQPPYSPDVFLFPKLKSTPKGRRFQTVEKVEETSQRHLLAIPQDTFQDAFQNWRKRWARSINSGWERFEGDKSDWLASKAIN